MSAHVTQDFGQSSGNIPLINGNHIDIAKTQNST
jgi:hypothetical protein